MIADATRPFLRERVFFHRLVEGIRVVVRERLELVFAKTGPINATVIVHHQRLHVSTIFGIVRVVLDAEKNLNRLSNVFNELNCRHLREISSLFHEFCVCKVLNFSRGSDLDIEEEEFKEAAHLL